MNFFKSIFTDDTPQNPNPNSNSPSVASASRVAGGGEAVWSLGGLMKTLATRSESIIEMYSRDLSEFRSNVDSETATLLANASRVVDSLPSTLDTGASIAQHTLESIGQAVDDLGSTVLTRLLRLPVDRNAPDNPPPTPRPQIDRRRLSRFQAQVHAIQSNSATYLEDPEDSDQFGTWKLGFSTSDSAGEIAGVLADNQVVRDMYSRLVPGVVHRERFWSRLFYRIHMLKLAEDARLNLVRRAVASENDEELRWDVDDDSGDGGRDGTSDPLGSPCNKPIDEKPHRGYYSNEKAFDEGGESGKESDFSVVSGRPSVNEEEELSWDEIEYVGEIDEKKVVIRASLNKDNLRKRLAAVDNDDEDLSWDIDEDD